MLHRTCTARIADLDDQLARARASIADRDRENTRLQGEAERNAAARWDAADTAEWLREQLAHAKERIADLAQEAYEATGPLAARRARAVRRTLQERCPQEAAALAALPAQAFATPEVVDGPYGHLVDGVRVTGYLPGYLMAQYGLTRSEAEQVEQQHTRAAV